MSSWFLQAIVRAPFSKGVRLLSAILPVVKKSFGPSTNGKTPIWGLLPVSRSWMTRIRCQHYDFILCPLPYHSLVRHGVIFPPKPQDKQRPQKGAWHILKVGVSAYFKVFFTFFTKASLTLLKLAILPIVKLVLSKRFFTKVSFPFSMPFSMPFFSPRL